MSEECSRFVKRMQEKNLSPMPIVGFYAGAASTACSFAMILDLGIMIRYYHPGWVLHFKCNIFSFSTTWLMALGVATKLTGDLTSLMWSPSDNFAKISSTAFLTMAMGLFFTQLGSMSDKDIVINVTSLGVLVITVIVDLCIQLVTGAFDYSLFPGVIFSIVFLFCMFMIIVSTALAVPTIKKCAALSYQKLASQIEVEWEQQHSVEELRLSVSKYWVMAASGSPHFLVKRLVTLLLTGITCLLSIAIYLVEGIWMENACRKWEYSHCQQESDYRKSVCSIIGAQTLALLPSGLINPFLLLGVMYYKYEENGFKISREEFIIESYWTKKLEEWRQSSILCSDQRTMVGKFLYKIKCLILTICIRLQIVIVIWCKFCYVLSFYSLFPFLFFDKGLNKLGNSLRELFYKNEVLNDQRRPGIDLNCFAILLEGEKQFPKKLLRSILSRASEHVEMGKKRRPQNLVNLLNQSFSFSGLVEFDSSQVTCLLSSDPPNSWTLPIVTLASIAIALPNNKTQHVVDWMVKCVDEGLRYARLIDVLDENCWLKNIKNAADVVWDGVVLHKKWLDMDLKRETNRANSAKVIIQVLANIAEKTVMEFKSTENRIIVESPLHWPVNVLAANSMYRISRTILLWYENAEYQAEEIFQKLMCMIADILTACLTNLPHVIATKCRYNAIEGREKSVRDAYIILEETEDILKHFEKYELSSLAPNKPFCIDEWRQWVERQDPIVSTSATINETPSTVDPPVGVVVQVQT